MSCTFDTFLALMRKFFTHTCVYVCDMTDAIELVNVQNVVVVVGVRGSIYMCSTHKHKYSSASHKESTLTNIVDPEKIEALYSICEKTLRTFSSSSSSALLCPCHQVGISSSLCCVDCSVELLKLKLNTLFGFARLSAASFTFLLLRNEICQHT